MGSVLPWSGEAVVPHFVSDIELMVRGLSVTFLPVINVNNSGRLVRGGSSSHQYQRKFNILIILIGGYILIQHADHCPVSPSNLTGGNWKMAYMELGLKLLYWPGVSTLPA